MKQIKTGLYYCNYYGTIAALLWYKGEDTTWRRTMTVLVGKGLWGTVGVPEYYLIYRNKVKAFVATLTRKKKYQVIRRIFLSN